MIVFSNVAPINLIKKIFFVHSVLGCLPFPYLSVRADLEVEVVENQTYSYLALVDGQGPMTCLLTNLKHLFERTN